jgi:hypothetical protein
MGKHERSTKRIKRVGENYISVCIHCDLPLIKPQDGSAPWALRRY